MACYKPLKGFRALRPNPSGKYSIVFSPRRGYSDLPMEVACGQCIGCRIERTRQWAVRCMHEASLYQDNCFITLTFDDDHLPKDGSLHKEDFQKFMKRLRKMYGQGIRYYHCGEYGDKNGRPHHHACLFGFTFPDMQVVEQGGKQYKVSPSLAKLWKFGFHIIGDVTFESAAYCARYIMKKITGKMAEDHYAVIDQTTGEYVSQRLSEYNTMSRRPGIGKGWYDKFKSDLYPDDFVVYQGGKIAKVPKFYDRQYEFECPEELANVKITRRLDAKRRAWDNTPDRLEVRETILKKKLESLSRSV